MPQLIIWLTIALVATVGIYWKYKAVKLKDENDRLDIEKRASITWKNKYQDDCNKYSQRIAELKSDIDQLRKEKIWFSDRLKETKQETNKMRTAWAVHQSFRVYGKPSLINLSAIVFAENETEAETAFVEKMAKHMVGKKIRTRTPLKANRVFPD